MYFEIIARSVISKALLQAVSFASEVDYGSSLDPDVGRKLKGYARFLFL